MSEISIANVISISVSETPQGAGEYNTSNIGCFTAEVAADSFGDDGFKIYLEPTEIGDDFGTESETYAMALASFSQNPNMLANNGYYVVILMNPEVQDVTFSATAASGTFILNFAGGATAAINWNDSASVIQAAIRQIAGLETATVTGSIASHTLAVTMAGYFGNAPLMTVTSNSLQSAVPAAIVVTVTQVTAGETYAGAITRTNSLIQYFGAMCVSILNEADTLAAAAVIQALNKLSAFVQRDPATVESGGILDKITTGSFTQSRGLFYGADSDLEALQMMAAYVGRAFSTNFNGSNTTQNMHLKTLATIQPDPSMTQTLLNKCQLAGADAYVSIQGIPKVFASGANKFFDQVYNLRWFVGALQIAGFNVLAQTSTKIVQTEGGVGQLKSAYRQVCDQAITNQYGAPGTWTSPNTFGNQEDFYANILQRGYYVFSQPVSQQSVANRNARKAPLIQIALKEAGAMDSSAVIVNVNA